MQLLNTQTPLSVAIWKRQTRLDGWYLNTTTLTTPKEDISFVIDDDRSPVLKFLSI